MKPLLVHYGDGDAGGGQIQMNRLLDGLRARGVEGRILCKQKTRSDSISIPRWRRAERLLGGLTGRIGLNDIHCFSSFRISEHEVFKAADLIDFHCLHGNFFNYLALPRLTARKPAVFTFHDMWPITGHCHASLECERWKTGCGHCPHLDIYPPVRRDATALEWKLKKWTYDRSQFTIIVPSRWLFDITKQSMLKDFPVHHVPHGIDTETFEPFDKDLCRSLLGVPKGKRVLLFAVDTLTRRLKGSDILQESLRLLPQSLRRELVLLVFGRSGNAFSRKVDIPVVDLGYVSNDRLKAIAFSAADLYLHPTRADNFALVLLESLACATPVVSFRVGGVPEAVRHRSTGMLADAEDIRQYTDLLMEALEDSTLREKMGQQCRQVAVREFDLNTYTERYLEIYEQAIAQA